MKNVLISQKTGLLKFLCVFLAIYVIIIQFYTSDLSALYAFLYTLNSTVIFFASKFIFRGGIRKWCLMAFISSVVSKNKQHKIALSGAQALRIKGLLFRKPSYDVDLIMNQNSFIAFVNNKIKLHKYFSLVQRNRPIEYINNQLSAHYNIYIWKIKIGKLDIFSVSEEQLRKCSRYGAIHLSNTLDIAHAKEMIVQDQLANGKKVEAQKHLYDLNMLAAYSAYQKYETEENDKSFTVKAQYTYNDVTEIDSIFPDIIEAKK